MHYFYQPLSPKIKIFVKQTNKIHIVPLKGLQHPESLIYMSTYTLDTETNLFTFLSKIMLLKLWYSLVMFIVKNVCLFETRKLNIDYTFISFYFLSKYLNYSRLNYPESASIIDAIIFRSSLPKNFFFFNNTLFSSPYPEFLHSAEFLIKSPTWQMYACELLCKEMGRLITLTRWRPNRMDVVVGDL